MRSTIEAIADDLAAFPECVSGPGQHGRCAFYARATQVADSTWGAADRRRFFSKLRPGFAVAVSYPKIRINSSLAEEVPKPQIRETVQRAAGNRARRRQ